MSAVSSRTFWRSLTQRLAPLRLAPFQSVLLRTASRPDVVECYRAILGREAESAEVVDGHLFGRPLLKDTIAEFARSSEIRFRFLTQPNYLAKSLDFPQRVLAHFTHYNFLFQALTAPAFQSLITSKSTLYELRNENKIYRVTASAHNRYEEGELLLRMNIGSIPIYCLGVTIVPGEVLSMAQSHVLLISRVQGARGAYGDIHQAARDFGDIHPSAVLLACVRGLATAIGVEVMAGVAAVNQPLFGAAPTETFMRAYDEFFAAAGAERCGDFFIFESKPKRRSPALASRPHARRAERKRRVKAEISAMVALEVSNWMKPPAAPDVTVLYPPPGRKRVA